MSLSIAQKKEKIRCDKKASDIADELERFLDELKLNYPGVTGKQIVDDDKLDTEWKRQDRLDSVSRIIEEITEKYSARISGLDDTNAPDLLETINDRVKNNIEHLKDCDEGWQVLWNRIDQLRNTLLGQIASAERAKDNKKPETWVRLAKLIVKLAVVDRYYRIR